MPYGIIEIASGDLVKQFGTLPSSFDIEIGGHRRRVVAPVQIGDEGLGHRFVNVVEVAFVQPGVHFDKGVVDQEISPDGLTVTLTQNWTPWDQARIDAFETARLDAIANEVDFSDNLMHAFVLVLIDELNRHSQVSADILQAAAAANNLADFKTRMGAIQRVPSREFADLRTALRNMLSAV